MLGLDENTEMIGAIFVGLITKDKINPWVIAVVVFITIVSIKAEKYLLGR